MAKNARKQCFFTLGSRAKCDGETLDLTPFYKKPVKDQHKQDEEKTFDLTPFFEKKVKQKHGQDKGKTLDLTPFYKKPVKDQHKEDEEKTFDLTPFFEKKVKQKHGQDKGETLDFTLFYKKPVKDQHKQDEEKTFDLTPFFEKKVKQKHGQDKGKTLDLTPFYKKPVKVQHKEDEEKTFDLTPFFEKKVKQKHGQDKGETLDLTPFYKKPVKDQHKQDEEKTFDLTPFFEKKVKQKHGQDKEPTFDLTPFFEKEVKQKHGEEKGETLDLTDFYKKSVKDKHKQDKGETIDLTPFFQKSNREKVVQNKVLTTCSEQSTYDKQNQDEELIEMNCSAEECTSESVQCLNAEIPTDNYAYKLYPDKINADLMNPCKCSIQCKYVLLQDGNIVYKVQLLRSECYSLKQGDKRLTKMLRLMIDSLSQETGKKVHLYQGKKICKDKWIDVLGISFRTYHRLFSAMKDGYVSFETPKKLLSHNYRGLSAQGIIQNMLDCYGDPSPEREVILLPDCINIKYMFDEYNTLPGSHLKKAAFYRIFQENFAKSVSFAKTKNINPCDICMKVKMELHKLTDMAKKEKLKEDLKIHLDRQRLERQDYYQKKGEAELKPTEAMSLIVDGMDQSKTNIPHFKGWTRPKAGSVALKTHITGCLAHGKQLFLFIDLLQWPHDPNMTISCLVKAISNNTSSLPPKLYIQCDNCGRENKNKYVIGFLGYLCLAGYVKEAHLSFLIKGHTHEDIDQRFSKISQRLRRVNALTLPELQKEVEESFSKKPHQEVLGCVWDVKEWLDPVLRDISAHSYQHQFWMFCDRPKHVVFKYRRFSSDVWLPEGDENQLELFDLDLSGDHLLPKGYPKYVIPKYEEGRFRDVQQAIQKMKSFLSYDQYTWWTDFLQDPEKTIKRNSRWPLLPLKKVNLLTNIPMEIQENSDPSCIGNMLLTEGTQREVVTKKRKRKEAD